MDNVASTTMVDSYENFLSYYPNILPAATTTTTATTTNTTFATEEDFHRIHNIVALPWRQMAMDVIFRIENIKRVKTKIGGDAVILHLCNSDGIVGVYWACSLLANELKTVSNIANLFVKSTGLKKSFNGREYYTYQLIQKN